MAFEAILVEEVLQHGHASMILVMAPLQRGDAPCAHTGIDILHSLEKSAERRRSSRLVTEAHLDLGDVILHYDLALVRLAAVLHMATM